LQYGRLVVIYSSAGRLRHERALVRLFDWIGTHYWFPGIQAPYNERFCERLAPEVVSRLTELDGGRLALPPGPAPRRGLCYLPGEADRLRRTLGWDTDFQMIGMPRFYATWRDTLTEIGGPVLEEELRKLGLEPDAKGLVTVILTAPNYFWYRHPGAFQDMLDIIVHRVRDRFPDAPILLKYKPQMKRFFTELEARYDDPKVRLTGCALAVLSTRSRFAISVQESSGVFDFLTTGVPVIEYGLYSDAWTALFPCKSSWNGLPGLTLAGSEAELVARLDDIAEGRLVGVDPARLASYLGHREDLSPLLDGPVRAGPLSAAPAPIADAGDAE
ncbi:MAG: hypothetical protein O7A03_04630, partial [Alphaproteobacteria bacterium]|nr:hypothetical protein [Alphaproteobacteria bacterium]